MTWRVGTSGYDYPHWRGVLYPDAIPERRWLEVYAASFDTLELNSTFYRLPTRRQFAAWAQAVPAGFRFALKASRYLTHVRRLRDPRPPVELLMDRASALGETLGPILLQLPPDLPIALDRLDAALGAFGRGTCVAVEPRHRSWFVDDLRELLRERQAALCLVDRRGPGQPLWRTTDWGYLRLHAVRASPESCYGRAALASWTGRLSDLWSESDAVWVYFNNDGHGCAVRNARTFGRLLRS